LKILADPQVQGPIISALIAGLVSFLVAWRTTRGGRKAREAERAEKLLLEVYSPIETFLLEKKSLYDYVTHNKERLAKNRQSFSRKIRPLIDEAITDHWSRPFGMKTTLDDLTLKEKQSEEKLKSIENRLRPLLADEIARLQRLVDKG
jgi:hypothetical protein